MSHTVTRADPRSRRLSRITVVTAFAAGGLLVATPLLVEFVAGDFFLLLPLALLLMVIALPGLRRWQQGVDGAAGKIGLNLFIGGLLAAVAAVVVGEVVELGNGPLIVAGAGSAATVSGLVLFTVGMLRAKSYPILGIVMFGPGLLLALITEAFEQSISGTVPTVADVLPPLLFGITGVGLILLAKNARSS